MDFENQILAIFDLICSTKFHSTQKILCELFKAVLNKCGHTSQTQLKLKGQGLKRKFKGCSKTT